MLSLLCNLLNKFNNTGARMLDSIYHRTLKYLKLAFFALRRHDFPSFTQRYNGRHNVLLYN